jgi:hypothetical protein
MNLKNISIISALTTIALTALTVPAQATAYRSFGGTYLELKEGGINVNDVPGAIGTGRYKSGPWNGTFTSTTITALPDIMSNGSIDQGARKEYKGNFQAANSSTGKSCTGQITIIRYFQGQGIGTIAADVTWANSSPGCPLINGGNPLNISEPVPYTTTPDFDFTAVNCRAGAGVANTLKHSFKAGNEMNARSPMSTGMGNGIVLASDGKPWLKVQNPSNPTTQCYVRASTNFIQPFRLGF